MAIRNDLLKILSAFCQLPVSQIKDGHKLKDDLGLRDDHLNFLSITIRGYMKKIKPSSKISAKELKKKDFTVGQLIDLVEKRLQP